MAHTRNLLSASAVTLAAITALAGCASRPALLAPSGLTIAPAPVTADGNVAMRPTDLVFMLVADADPRTPGVALASGERLRLSLPGTFRRNPDTPLSPDTDANLVLTKGWPQGAVRLAEQYRIGYDEAANAVTISALQDVATTGMNAPGVKAIHLRGRTFVNPGPGIQEVSVSHVAADGRTLARWQGTVSIADSVPPARLAPTNFHVAPGTNVDFQKVPAGSVAPLPLGLLLWGPEGAPLNGVGIAPRDLGHYPRYTGGLLVQDTNGDRLLDPAVDKVVGGIIGAAPAGATGQAAISPIGPDGKPVLSGTVLRHAGYPPAAGGGKPVAGLLAVQFKAGSATGMYRPTFELIGGNAFRYTVDATSP